MELSLERWLGKVAVVTGASAGIGAAIAERLVEKGIVVAGLARRKEKLDKLATKLKGKPGKFYPIKTDISKEDEILNAFQWIKTNLGPVHILINNAATLKIEDLSTGTTKTWENMFQINVIGLCICTREAISQMNANNIDGQIIHINSRGGHRVPSSLRGLSTYPASKFAVTALAETLKVEMNMLKTRIKVTSLSPGLVDTELIPESLKSEDFHADGKILKPGAIADGVIYILSTPPTVLVSELTIQPIFEPY